MSSSGTPVASPSGESYPEGSARDRFVLDRRPARAAHDPWRHQGLLFEDERRADGRVVPSATLFLTGRECPWRCVMCDLWRHTTEGDTPRGAIPAQIDAARDEIEAGRSPRPSTIKLYNAGSFFDPRAVPEADYGAIAGRLSGFDDVVVECHPALVGERVDRFRGALLQSASPRGGPRLEVAMGLETAHPEALERLHKRMTLDQFAHAAQALLARGASLRAFVLVGPPFVPPEEQDEWLVRSVDFAFSTGAAVVSLIPTRAGNGAMEALTANGLFEAPRLADLERAMARVLPRSRGRVFADLWDLARLADCPACLVPRTERLRQANLGQRLALPVACPRCGGSAA